MRNRNHFVAGGLCAVLATAACVSADDDTARVEQAGDVPGVGLSKNMYPLMNESVTPLSPVNSVTKAVFAPACISKPDGTGPAPGEFQKAAGGGVAYVQYARSRSAVDDALAVKISAAFAGPTAGASGEVEASVSSKTQADSVYLLGELFAYTHLVLSASCPLVLTENATELLLDESAFGGVPAADLPRYRAAAFMRVCGDSWTHTQQLGMGATLILEFKSKTVEDKAKIRAELEASFGKPVMGVKIGASVAASRDKLTSNSTMTAKLVAKGAIPGMPAPNDIDENPGQLTALVQKLDELKQTINEPGADVTNLIPMAARLGAYDGVPPWGGWKKYDAAKKQKIRDALALIKPIAEEMEKFLALRANLVKELEYGLSQIETIKAYGTAFNYDGSQKNYAGTAALPQHGTTPSYGDLAAYKTSFAALRTKLHTEMDACKDDGARGFMKCKPNATLVGVVAKEIRKWRTNRPRKLDVWKDGPTNSAANAQLWCNGPNSVRPGGQLVSNDEAYFTRAWAMAYLPVDTNAALWGTAKHVHFLRDAMEGEKCTSTGGVAHSYVWVPDDEKYFYICGGLTQPMWQLAALCRGATSLWDDNYWKDELDLTGL